MSTDNEHLSLPHLYGAPAHTPRRMAAPTTPTPLGPDDLPIETYRTPEDQAMALELFPRAYTSQVVEAGARPFNTNRSAPAASPQLRPRPLLLRALAGRLMRPKGH